MISYEQYLDYSPYFAQIDIEAPSSRAEFLELFSKTPQSVKDFIVSTETAERVFSLGTSLSLDEYDTEAIAYVIRQITIGEIPLTEAVNTVIREIKVSPDVARKILNSCLRDLLTPILEEFKKIQVTRFPESVVQSQNRSVTNSGKASLPAGVNPSNVVDLRSKQN